MSRLANEWVIVIVDGPDPDNYACVLAATSQRFGLKVAAVIMTGRPVSAVHSSTPYEFNPHASRAVRRDNALHMKGILMRHGREGIPVFEGLRAPFSTVPHRLHIHERVTDIRDDAHAGHVLAGDIDDAVAYLAKLNGPIHVVCGGPLTDLAYLMRQPSLRGKLGMVTAQLGMFGFGDVETMAGGRRQFNTLADPTAARDVLMDYDGPVYMIPTDITKDPGHAFATVDELAALAESSSFRELVAMYEAAWPVMWGPRGEKIFVHDFHPAELMAGLLRDDGLGRYQVSLTGIYHVPYLSKESEMERWGEIDLAEPDGTERFLVDGVDTLVHRRILAEALNSEAYVAPALLAHGLRF